MSKTDKTKPGRLKKLLGELPPGRGYIKMANHWAGRPAAYGVATKISNGKNRAAEREALRLAKSDPEEADVLPDRTGDVEWEVY